MNKPLVAILFALAITILASRAAAQEDCFPHDVAVVKTNTSVRESPNTNSRMVGPALVGATYAIRNSQDVRDRCWVQTDEGWLYGPFVRPVGGEAPVEQKVQSWSASGNREVKRSVTLELTEGVYKLNALRGFHVGGRGAASLIDIIARPESCFVHYEVTFPATLRIERDCTVYATLQVLLDIRGTPRSWSLSITKESDTLPAIPYADGWSERGPGYTRRPLELVFEPGIYRIDATGGDTHQYIELVDGPYCLSSRYISLPTQVRVTKRCAIKAKIRFHGYEWDDAGPWSYSVTKLGGGDPVSVPNATATAQQSTDIAEGEVDGGACYDAPNAYVNGAMNIRQSPTTGSARVGQAQAGDVLAVSDSRRGPTYCWLKVAQGWIARTGRVSAIKPVVAAPESAPQTAQDRDIDNCCYVDRQCTTEQEWTDGYWAYRNNLCEGAATGSAVVASGGHPPTIQGSLEFVAQINAGLDLLRSQSSAWYNYVVSPTRVIQPSPGGRSVAYGARALIEILDDHLQPPLQLASFLVHEACHLHQWNEGRYPGWFDWEGEKQAEIECFTKQLGYVTEIDPSHWLVGRIRSTLRHWERR